jgi:hypothetical protein
MESCFAFDHMTCRQFGLWNRIQGLQRKFGFVYFDADYLAAHFQSTSRDVIYDDCAALLGSGWFELLAERKRKKDGTWESRKVHALTHKEWAARYPDKCKAAHSDHSANSHWNHSANSDAPVGKQRRTSRQIAIDQSLPDDKDFVLKQTSFKSDVVQSRRESDADAISGSPNGILDSLGDTLLGNQPLPADAPALRAPRPVAAPVRLTGNAPNGRPWSEWQV